MKEWAAAFYGGEAWAKMRAAYLAARGGLCERCLKGGEIEPAKIVHHKTYLRPENIDDPRVSLNWDNLEALCQDCHNREHHGRRRKRRYRYGPNGELLPGN